ncbi:Gfo/Idh/MocA family oxidoreductase [Mesorhizobium sp. RMAD-H1]|uniref:Gfo/Idh/MocA family protein n=1 Tax=Mesorhizobium sp. RMAD-H1 TaxID=2587065 RepID=UPI00184971BD|nr:1,5-anhydro-D-fructose reductase (1,5-anhydro-D-mannitol-forming) [Mesorhizobium sp. RMAD-H1]
MRSTEELGWSVMGTGTIATEHMVAAIRTAGHQPRWVVSRNKEYAKLFSQDMQVPNTSLDARRALHDPFVKFAYVSAARERRRHYIAAAASERKHVLCDGPIAASSRVAAGLVEQCRQAGIVLALNQPARAASPHQTMRRLVQEGEIGTLQLLSIVRGAPFHSPPNRHMEEEETKGDILLDMSIESIDLARFLTGQEPVEVSALSSVPQGTDADQLSYAIRMSDGALFQALESFATAEFESTVMLAGDRGTLIAHGTLSGRAPGALIRRLHGRNELIPLRDRDPHIATIEGFLDATQKSATWICLGEDSVVALRTAEAIAAVRRKRHLPIAAD